MSAPINLQAVVLRLRAAVIAAQSQIDKRQLNSLMGILDSLLDVAYVANDHQLAALLESLLDAVRDTIHGVGWKSEIPSVDTVIMAVPTDTRLSTGMTSQPSLLRDFLNHVVTEWARTAYATDHVQVIFDDHRSYAVAETRLDPLRAVEHDLLRRDAAKNLSGGVMISGAALKSTLKSPTA